MPIKKLFPRGRRSTYPSKSPRRRQQRQQQRHDCQGRDESQTPPCSPDSMNTEQDIIVAPVRSRSLVRGCYDMKEKADDVLFELNIYLMIDDAASKTSSNVSKTTDFGDTAQRRPVFTTLAAMFQQAVFHNNDASVQDITLRPLIDACWAFERQMRRCKNVMAAKDFSQNILKVQRVLDDAPLSVKTVSGLLAYEKSTGCHHTAADPEHPQVKLRDPSAAMGLLWIRRNLMFQYQIYLNAFMHAMDPREAALAAYRQELDPHLGNSWTLRKLFQLGCKVTVPICSRVFLAKLNDFDPHAFSKEQQVLAMQEIEAFLTTLQPVLARWEQIFRELGLEE